LDYGSIEYEDELIGLRGYLVQTHAGDHVLVDTGWEPRHVEDASARKELDAVFASGGRRLHVGPDNLVKGQLHKIGLLPADVTTVVVTHGGVDRVGGLDAFQHARVVVSQNARAQPTRAPAMAWPERDYSVVRGDVVLWPGVDLLATPGHAPGHLSVLVRLGRTGSVVLAIHALASKAELAQGVGEGASDQASWKASAEKLVRIAHEQEALMVYGYGSAAETAVRAAPEYYD
jgi:N-acyl homoserine lactone hydrolase